MQQIAGFYRYHLIYLIVALIMAWVQYPYPVYTSFILMGGFCVGGLLCLVAKQYIGSQILAVAIGLAGPIIFFLQLSLSGTLLLFGGLIVIVFLARDLLFFQ